MIPRRLHWIWLGGEQIPERHRTWMAGWRELHPSWEYKVWTDADRPRLRNEELFTRARTPAQQADILRYELVLDVGGVYLDTDVECLRPLDDLLAAGDAFIGRESSARLGTAIFGATAGHPWMEALVGALPESVAGGGGTLAETGPDFVTRHTVGRSDVVVFDPEIFYPFDARRRADPPPPRSGTYAIHHWEGSWWDDESRMWDDFRRRVTALVDSCVPRHAVIALIDDNVGLPELAIETRPFPERNGIAWGRPQDDDGAVRELAISLEAGVTHLAVLLPAFWWLDHYDGFQQHLRSSAVALLEDPEVIIFDLAFAPVAEHDTAVDRRISPDERMPHANESHYFAVGESAIACMDVALEIAGRPWESIERALDLPCGHGRVLRNLRSRMPSATIYACDLMEDGVQYCADTFGAVPVVSVPDPADLVLPGPFDLIWCGSLLTHLSAEDCISFMRLFERNLTPGGVVVVTLHGREVLRRIREGKPYGLGDRAPELIDEVAANGFAFRDHDGQSWGISASSPAWVFDHLVGDLRLIGYTEEGWDDHQDVLACQRLPDRS